VEIRQAKKFSKLRRHFLKKPYEKFIKSGEKNISEESLMNGLISRNNKISGKVL